MDKLIKWLENSFAPKLQKITNLTWIVVIKDSMMQLLPLHFWQALSSASAPS